MLPVLHLIGDIHTGGISANRKASFTSDIPNLPRVERHLQVGDLTEMSTTSQDTEALAVLDALPSPWIAAIGNHDTVTRNGDAAAAALGLPGRNQSHDLGFCQVIVLGHFVDHGVYIVLDAATLDFLDAELAACAPKPAIVMAHAPLYNTAIGSGTFSSHIHPWFIVANELANATNEIRDQPIRDILAAHDNALMWLAGHTHHPISASTLWTTRELGGKHVIVGNASALYYTVPPSSAALQELSRICSQIVYVLRDRVEVRYRNHGTRRSTVGPNGQRLTIIYYDDGLVVHERRAA